MLYVLASVLVGKMSLTFLFLYSFRLNVWKQSAHHFILPSVQMASASPAEEMHVEMNSEESRYQVAVCFESYVN